MQSLIYDTNRFFTNPNPYSQISIDTFVTINGNGVNSVTLPLLSTKNANETILVFSDESQDASTISSVTITDSNTQTTPLIFTKVVSVNKGSTQGNVEIWMAKAPFALSSAAITVTYTGSNFPQCTVSAVAFTGVNSVTPTGATATNTGSSTTPNISLNANNNSLVVAMIGQDGNVAVTPDPNLININVTNASVSKLDVLIPRFPANARENVVFRSTLGSSIAWGMLAVELIPEVFYQNSFLYTIRKMIPSNGNYDIVGPRLIQSGIVIDNITKGTGQNSGIASLDHTTSSQNAVAIGLLTVQGSGIGFIKYNSTALKLLSSLTITKKSGSQITQGIFYMNNPPVGNYPITLNSAIIDIVFMTVLGVNKKLATPNFLMTSGSGNTATINISNKAPNSLIIDQLLAGDPGSTTTTAIPSINQTMIQEVYSNGGGSLPQGVSYIYAGVGQQKMSWKIRGTISPFWSYSAIILEPDQAYSPWNASIKYRNSDDVVRKNSLDVKVYESVIDAKDYAGYKASTFFQNSFLHTLGRVLPSPPGIAAKVAETEQRTSQIVIDKVYQGQIGAGQTLNMDVNIPSQDADIIVTGGSVIATGGAWQAVTLNGSPMTRLVQTGVAGQSSEIWWSPRPGVGTKTLSIVPTAITGQVYANAMIVLGLDNRNQNIITTSITDAAATQTIVGQITPDAPNSLIIANLTAFDALANPVPDASQTQVFNATALNTSENVLTTYEIQSNTQQIQSFNLSTASNASLVVAVFRPNQAASAWFPNVGLRQLSDVVDTSGLDTKINPTFGSYGYKASTFYKNSFLHTIGRMLDNNIPLARFLREGLISYYKLDDQSGNNVRDETGIAPAFWRNGSNMIQSNWAKGKINGGAAFSGGTDSIVTNSANPFKFLLKVSISAWIYMTDIQQSTARVVANDGGAIGFALWVSAPSTPAFNIGNTSTNVQAVGSALPTKQWIHLVGTYDGGTIRLYVNGVLKGSNSILAGPSGIGAGSVINIGGNGVNRGFSGFIDEVGVWKRDLSQNEVAALYNNGQGLSYPFLPNSNQFAIGVMGYNYYNSPTGRAWQTSFLQTIGRRIYDPNTPALVVNAFNATLLMMGVG